MDACFPKDLCNTEQVETYDVDKISTTFSCDTAVWIYVVVGTVVLLAILGAVFCFMRRNKNKTFA